MKGRKIRGRGRRGEEMGRGRVSEKKEEEEERIK